jgi:arylsulfatase A-like enzyme
VSRTLPILAAALLAGFAGGCTRRAPPPAAPAAPGPPWNVVLVLVDTLRADRTSLYGYGRPTTPNLERFARDRAVVFDQAWSNAACTFPSVNSLLTSRWPQHFMTDYRERGMGMPPGTPTVAELLRDAGYATAAVSASWVVRKEPSSINPTGGYDAGFDTFQDKCIGQPAPCVNRWAFRLLDRLPEPYFLYLHYIDPHNPYQPPPRYERTWADPGRAPDQEWVRRGEPTEVIRKLNLNQPHAAFDATDLAYLADLYDDEIRYFDTQLQRLLNRLGKRGGLKRTVVVVTSDHGEELGDFGHWGHCGNLAYPDTLGIPLLIAAPGLAPGRRATPVSNIDLVPTLLDLLGVDAAGQRFEGSSLRALLADGDAAGAGRAAPLAAQGIMRGTRTLAAMLRLDITNRGFRGFSLAGARPVPESDFPDELRRALIRWTREQDRDLAAAAARSAELEQQLRAVGYL